MSGLRRSNRASHPYLRAQIQPLAKAASGPAAGGSGPEITDPAVVLCAVARHAYGEHGSVAVRHSGPVSDL
ncbi:hypothetical protein Stube_45890 [Streptomyces tubercidicus]|uniref:Uncharacterized protein n=1 Tax=Streptomyces tubercidicus TaxID=47759 RepID=A0A640V120_9ACTN|nr:hypothetical protein Stube_45890 [Streptomyces tubercidicus]